LRRQRHLVTGAVLAKSPFPRLDLGSTKLHATIVLAVVPWSNRARTVPPQSAGFLEPRDGRQPIARGCEPLDPGPVRELLGLVDGSPIEFPALPVRGPG
jgi:hypothetical protein